MILKSECLNCGEEFDGEWEGFACEGDGGHHWCCEDCAAEDGYRKPSEDQDEEDYYCPYCVGLKSTDADLFEWLLQRNGLSKEDAAKLRASEGKQVGHAGVTVQTPVFMDPHMKEKVTITVSKDTWDFLLDIVRSWAAGFADDGIPLEYKEAITEILPGEFDQDDYYTDGDDDDDDE